MKSKFPEPPYRTIPGMSWDTDGNRVYIFQDKVLVMVLSVSEIIDIRKRNVYSNQEGSNRV
jgi:hypothetical protein